MKKLIRFLAVFSACASITAIAASAASSQPATCAVANGIGENGYHVAVTVTTKRACDGVQGNLIYDAAKYTPAENNNPFVKKTEDGVLKFAVVGDTENGSTSWVTVNFVSATPASKEDFSLEDGKAVAHEDTESSSVRATTFLYGDANDDDTINIVDLVRVKKVVAQVQDVEVNAGADCDANGEHNVDDISRMVRYLLGIQGAGFGA